MRCQMRMPPQRGSSPHARFQQSLASGVLIERRACGTSCWNLYEKLRHPLTISRRVLRPASRTDTAGERTSFDHRLVA